MIDNTKVIENLLRMADGLPVQMRGPTGKQHWFYPEFADVRWAMDRVLKRCLPELTGITLSGEADGAPIVLANRPADPEVARRLALLQRVIDAPEESQDAPADDRPLGKGNGGNGAQRVLEAPAETPIDVCQPPVGAAVVVDRDRAVTLTRMSDDGKQDHGGEWRVEQHGKQVKLLRGITAEGAAAVVQAMDQQGRFDDA